MNQSKSKLNETNTVFGNFEDSDLSDTNLSDRECKIYYVVESYHTSKYFFFFLLCYGLKHIKWCFQM